MSAEIWSFFYPEREGGGGGAPAAPPFASAPEEGSSWFGICYVRYAILKKNLLSYRKLTNIFQSCYIIDIRRQQFLWFKTGGLDDDECQ